MLFSEIFRNLRIGVNQTGLILARGERANAENRPPVGLAKRGVCVQWAGPDHCYVLITQAGVAILQCCSSRVTHNTQVCRRSYHTEERAALDDDRLANMFLCFVESDEIMNDWNAGNAMSDESGYEVARRTDEDRHRMCTEECSHHRHMPGHPPAWNDAQGHMVRIPGHRGGNVTQERERKLASEKLLDEPCRPSSLSRPVRAAGFANVDAEVPVHEGSMLCCPAMVTRVLRVISTLDLEEQILNSGAMIAMVGVFLPWLSGEWLGGDEVIYSGLGFYTSFLGLVIFLLHAFILLITAVPLTGGPVLIRKRYRELVRLCAALQATILVLAALSVLTKVTFEFSRMEVRFGIYVCLIGSLVAVLYAFLRLQEQRRSQVQELFHHPEDFSVPPAREGAAVPPPPPPPPPPAPEPEEHRIFV